MQNAPFGQRLGTTAAYRPPPLAWLPIPALLIAMLWFWAAPGSFTYESPLLLMALNFVFSSLSSLFIAFLVGRSFLIRGTPGLLAVGAGALVWGFAGFVGVVVGQHDPNLNITIHNSAALVAAACHFAGLLLFLRPRPAMRAPVLWLAAACTMAMGSVLLIAQLAPHMPTFFVQGRGGTPFRQYVLACAICMFLATAVGLRAVSRPALSPFRYWYTLALVLIAAGLAGVMVQSSFGSPLNWTARGVQYVGGVYMLIAAILSLRDTKEWGISLETALTEARQRFDELFELAADGIVLHDLEDGSLVQANRSLCDLLGYTPRELEQLSFTALLAPEDRTALLSEIAAMTARGVRHEKTFLAKDGRSIPVELNTQIVHGGKRALAMSVIRDITERKRAEQEARANEERLRQAQKLESIGLLAGGIAHDFNNLLVGIVGNASLAQDMVPPDSPVLEVLDRILACGEQAAHLTRQMLAYAGKGQFIVEPVSLSAIAETTRPLIQSSISKKIEVAWSLHDRIPAVESDPSQLQQILMNLVLNAAEAIGSAAGAIEIATGAVWVDSDSGPPSEWRLEPGQYAFLQVRDSGCGMDEETRARIFDPFFTTKFQGRGLGLAAVAGIVRGHRGAIHVDTAPGMGSTFRVLFPASADTVAPAANLPLHAAARRGEGTILIVDDEQFVLDFATRALEAHGYEVVAARSGPGAIGIVRDRGAEIRLAILDLSMPQMAGEEVLAEIRTLAPELPVVVSSGFSENQVLQAFAGEKVSGFIQKPYTANHLADLVGEVLDPRPTA